MTEMTVAAGVQQLVVAEGGHVEDKHIVVVFAVFGHGVWHHVWHGSGMAQYYTIAIMDVLDGLLWCGDFPFIFVFPVHKQSL
jgi:hypothetical protein